MQIELIDEMHLKITLRAAQLRLYNIDPTSMSYENEDTRRLIKSLLFRANTQTGFTYLHYRLLIEVFPTSDGGCVVYVTNTGKKTTPAARFRMNNITIGRVYCFEDAGSLMEFAEKIYPRRGLFCSSRLYLLHGSYYLAVKLKTSDSRAVCAAASEYALKSCLQSISYYNERAQLICESGAIEKIGALLQK